MIIPHGHVTVNSNLRIFCKQFKSFVERKKVYLGLYEQAKVLYNI